MALRISDAQVAALGAAGCGVQSCLEPLGIRLLDRDGDPVSNEPFEVELPHGATIRGLTGRDGRASLEAVPTGACKVTFPALSLVRSCVGGVPQTFERPGVPTVVRLELLDREGKPRAGVRYELACSDVIRRGATDDRGFLEEKVSPRVAGARLTLTDGEDREEIDLVLDGRAGVALPARTVARQPQGTSAHTKLASLWETRHVRVAQGGECREHAPRYLQTRRLPGLVVDRDANLVYESPAQRVRYEVTFVEEESEMRLETENLLAVYAGKAAAPRPLGVAPLRCRALVLIAGTRLGHWQRDLRRRWPRTAGGNDAYMLDRIGTVPVAGFWLHRLFTYPRASAWRPWRDALEYAKRMTNRDLLAHGEPYQMVTM
jgi:hypothetical protein